MYVPNHSFSSPAPVHGISLLLDGQQTHSTAACRHQPEYLILVIAMLFLIFLQRSS